MAYEGELLISCPTDIDFTATQAVVVSGASWNPCGHMILCAGSDSATSWYFHVAGAPTFSELYGFYAFPKFLREGDFAHYLSDNGKHEIRRMDAAIRNPAAAYTRLMQLMADKWFWRVLPHNCASFAKEIISAGEGNLTVLLNCPDQEVAQKFVTGLGKAIKRVGEFQRSNPGPKW